MIRVARFARFTAAAALIAAVGPAAFAQSLESRVASAPDGRVQFSFPSRPGVCGNGRSYIQTSPNNFTGNISSNGTYYTNDGMRVDPCIAGPVRVVIDRADKLPLTVQ